MCDREAFSEMKFKIEKLEEKFDKKIDGLSDDVKNLGIETAKQGEKLTAMTEQWKTMSKTFAQGARNSTLQMIMTFVLALLIVLALIWMATGPRGFKDVTGATQDIVSAVTDDGSDQYNDHKICGGCRERRAGASVVVGNGCASGSAQTLKGKTEVPK